MYTYLHEKRKNRGRKRFEGPKLVEWAKRNKCEIARVKQGCIPATPISTQ